MDGVTRPMRARTASPEEKASLWPEIVAAYKGYDGYQQKAHRDIPVVILEPRAAPDPARSDGTWPGERARTRRITPKTWRYDAPNVDGAHRLARAAR